MAVPGGELASLPPPPCAPPHPVEQVANRTCVVLFDLLTLCQHHPAALEACLGPLLSGASVLKVGFEVAGDLSKLAGSWPGVQAFRQVVGVLDLRPLWVAYGVANKHQVGAVYSQGRHHLVRQQLWMAEDVHAAFPACGHGAAL